MKTQTTTAEAGPAIDGAFLAMMQNHRRGETLSDLGEALREVTEAVKLTGKAGSFSLKVKIRPASKGGAMIVEDSVTTSLPKTEAEGSIFFADDEGNLLREDPNQKTLPLREIKGGLEEQQQPLKEVAK